jgi:hypothetical protein
VAKPRPPFQRADVATVFAAYPRDVRNRLLELRALIFDTAAGIAAVGPLEETLRWGEPSYLTTRSKSGSLVRIHWKPADGDRVRVYFHCQTNLVATFRAAYPTELDYDGNRAIALPLRGTLPIDALVHCVSLALTYHADRRARRA